MYRTCRERIYSDHVVPFWHFLMILVFSFSLFGCGAGTVSESSSPEAKVGEKDKGAINFEGLVSANPISDTRIELFFYPAKGGSSKYVYDINFSNSPQTISVSSDTLVPDYRGLLKYTLKDLTRMTNYQIRVSARDQLTGAPGTNDVIKSVTTYTHEVARFDGILAVSNLAGQDGKDSLKIRWKPAQSSGGLTLQSWDPKTYEIVIVNAALYTPGDMDVPGLTSADGVFKYLVNHDNSVNEYVARGLPSNTKFYVRIRALHETSVDDIFDETKRGERNTQYLSISTLSNELADIDFQPDSFTVVLREGQEGLTSADLAWEAAKGVFDHYRIYYTDAGATIDLNDLPELCLSVLLTLPAERVYCKKATTAEVVTPLSGLEAYQAYQAVLVLCQTSECSDGQRIISPVRTFETDPSVASFSGILPFETAQSYEDLGTLKVNYSIPNFQNGYFDGLILKLRRSTDPTAPDEEISEVSAEVYHDSYNFMTQNSFTVRGINYLSLTPYCFTLYPFKYESNGINKNEFPNDVWRCFQPEIIAPAVEDFDGLKSAKVGDDGYVNLEWDIPEKGIYTSYELFWKKSDTIFSWNSAIAETTAFNFTNYGRSLINKDIGQFSTVGPFMDGTYLFGMVTHYQYVTEGGASVVLRSETNTNIYKCVVSVVVPSTGNIINCTK